MVSPSGDCTTPISKSENDLLSLPQIPFPGESQLSHQRTNLRESEGSGESPIWGATGMCPTRLGLPRNRGGSAVAGNAPPNLNMSPRGGGARWAVAASGKGCRARGFRASPRGERSTGTRPAGSGAPGLWGGRSRARANLEFPRVGELVPAAGGRAGRQLPGPSPTSPPPGFLRRPRPPCCCGAEAAPRSPSGRDRLRNRFAVGGLATNRAAAATAEQGLPAFARGCAAGTKGRGVAL